MVFVRICGFDMSSPTDLEAAALSAALGLAPRLADTAGALALRWFRTSVEVHTKADDSPVTIADRDVERAMRELIAQQAPGDGIYGEEHGRERADADGLWVLDPIDGTAAFITGSPLWGNLVAWLWRGRPVLGVLNAPALRERWVGAAGAPTQHDGADCRTSGCTRLADARVYTTSPDTFDAAQWRAFDAVSRAAAMRRFGGDCINYGLLASGHVDLVIEAGLAPYDYLALVPVIEGAGGVVTDWDGQPLHLGSDGRVVAAATRELHREVLGRL
jgi:inositol-phosphate phosphatase/L-galactose 1-phosphate phosphatase/histidinol-phosphatase